MQFLGDDLEFPRTVEIQGGSPEQSDSNLVFLDKPSFRHLLVGISMPNSFGW